MRSYPHASRKLPNLAARERVRMVVDGAVRTEDHGGRPRQGSQVSGRGASDGPFRIRWSERARPAEEPPERLGLRQPRDLLPRRLVRRPHERLRRVEPRGADCGRGARGGDGRNVMAAREFAEIWGEQMHAARHLRVVAGAAASAIPLSAWLVTFCFAFFLALATVKRQTELTRTAATAPIRGRGYRRDHSGWLTALGVLAAAAASVTLMAYGFSPSAAVLYDQPTLFSWVAAPVGMWLAHTLYEGWHGRVDDDPVIYALRAYSSYLAIGTIGVVVAAAL